MCDKYFGSGPLLQAGSEKTFTDAIFPTVKLIFLYFSKHDCKPCLEFTPVFAELYAEQAPERVFEVVFCSGDPTSDEFTKYYAEMPWLALPHKD